LSFLLQPEWQEIAGFCSLLNSACANCVFVRCAFDQTEFLSPAEEFRSARWQHRGKELRLVLDAVVSSADPKFLVLSLGLVRAATFISWSNSNSFAAELVASVSMD
jgi:hypothetical protein